MKKIWVYLLGILTGIVLTFVVTFIFTSVGNSSQDVTYFDEPGEIITAQTLTGTTDVKSFEVFQALEDGFALAQGNQWGSYDMVVLLVNKEQAPYYDGQKVNAPSGKCFRQIGIYRYLTTEKEQRTVPIVMMMDGGSVEKTVDDSHRSKKTDGMTFFDEPGEVMADNSYKVWNVVSDGAAKARGKSDYGSSYFGMEVLLWDEDANFYDDQIVKAPQGKCFRQIGIFKQGFSTYPIVALMDK